VLLTLPTDAAWRFWFPAKIARQHDEDSPLLTLSIPPDFEAKIFRSEKGADHKWNKVEEKVLSRAEFIKALRPSAEEAAEIARHLDSDLEMASAPVSSGSVDNNNDDDDIPF